MYLAVYVDDILVAAHSTAEVEEFETAFCKKVSRIKSGVATRYIGLDIERDRGRRTITLSQGPFTRELLRSERNSG
jgi:hypothetical protein